MASFDTGNAAWDQGLSSLGNALFPDPGRVAQGYYYGTEARKALIEGNRITGQQNADNVLTMGLFNGQIPRPTFAPASFTGGAPVLQSPANLPMAGQPASLSATVVPTPAQVTTAAANTLPNAQPYMTGTPAGASTPAPGSGAPSAPNTTSSDGSVTPTTTDGVLHPASFNQTPGQGGTVQAGPAAANGSPAVPAFSLLQFVGMSQAAGRDAASSMAIGKAYLGSLLAQGQISESQFRQQLASVGEPSPYNTAMDVAGAYQRQQLANASAANVAKIQVAGELEKQRIANTGAQERTPPFAVADVKDPNKVTFYPTNAPTLQNPAGTPGYNPATVTGGGAFHDYMDPNTGVVSHVSEAQANQQKLVEIAPTSDAATARAVQEIQAMPEGPAKQAKINSFLSLQSAGKTVTPAEGLAQQQGNYIEAQQIYAKPQTGWFTEHKDVTSPVAFTQAAQNAIDNRIVQLRTQNVQYRNDPGLAFRTAVYQLGQEGVIPTPEQVNVARNAIKDQWTSAFATGDRRVGMAPNLGVKGAPVQPHMMIGLLKQPGPAPAPGAAPAQPMTVEGAPVTNAAPPAAPTAAPTPNQPAPAPTVPSSTPPTRGAPVVQTNPRGQGFVRPAPTPVPPGSGRGMGRTPTNPSPNLSTILPPAAPAFTAAPPAAPAAPAAAAPAPAVSAPGARTVTPAAGGLSTAMPAGAVAQAQGTPDFTFVTLSDGRPGIVRGGWVYPR